MGRVILITSREIDKVITGLSNNLLEVKDTYNLENQFFCNYTNENGNGLLYTVFIDNESLIFESEYVEFSKIEYTCDTFDSKFPLNIGEDILEIKSLDFSKVDRKKLLLLIGRLIAEKRKEKYENIVSFIGKIKYLKVDSAFIFFSYEFPHEIYKEAKSYYPKAQYLAALINDIQIFLKQQNESAEEWLFINHDYDWFDISKGSRRIKKSEPDNTILLEKMLNHSYKLSEIYNLDKFELFVFSHTERLWNLLLSCLDNNKLENLANNKIDEIASAYIENLTIETEKCNDKYPFIEIYKDKFSFDGNTQKNVDLIFKPTYFKETKKYVNAINIKPLIIIGEKSLKDISKIKHLDRFFKFVDSSIWVRYVQKMEGCKNDCLCDNAENNKCPLYRTIKEINEYHQLGLYRTNNALEIIEFKARMAVNSYLSEVGGHDKYVVPFLFHSETEMRRLAVGDFEKEEFLYFNNEKEKDEESQLAKLKKFSHNGKLEWRFLLIDDHATVKAAEDARIESSSTDESSILPKCLILRAILSPYFTLNCMPKIYDNECKNCDNEICKKLSINSNNGDPNLIIHFDCVTNISDAKKKIAEKRYDLILIDYLLEPNNDINGVDQRHYAYELLNSLNDLQDRACNITIEELEKWGHKNTDFLKHWKGPNGKFHFFFISAFTNAVNERMLAEGLNFHGKNWNISRGACPTTTPHLFLYFLLKFMNRQIDELKTNTEFLTLIDLLFEIYCDEENNEIKIKPRDKAITLFNSLLQMRLTYGKLKYDACLDYKGKLIEGEKMKEKLKSPLVNSLFTDIEFYDYAFWEHTMHLVYLTAFGTIRQWPDMWEEFMLIKPNLHKALSKNSRAAEVIKGIEKYITDLHHQSI